MIESNDMNEPSAPLIGSMENPTMIFSERAWPASVPYRLSSEDKATTMSGKVARHLSLIFATFVNAAHAGDVPAPVRQSYDPGTRTLRFSNEFYRTRQAVSVSYGGRTAKKYNLQLGMYLRSSVTTADGGMSAVAEDYDLHAHWIRFTRQYVEALTDDPRTVTFDNARAYIGSSFAIDMLTLVASRMQAGKRLLIPIDGLLALRPAAGVIARRPALLKRHLTKLNQSQRQWRFNIGVKGISVLPRETSYDGMLRVEP